MGKNHRQEYMWCVLAGSNPQQGADTPHLSYMNSWMLGCKFYLIYTQPLISYNVIATK